MKTREEIEDIVSNVNYPDRKFILLSKGDGYLLQLRYMERDINTGNVEEQHSRKYYISPHATETEIVETAFLCVKRSMEHVAGEHFTYRGRRVYSPHFAIDARMDLCDDGDFDSR